jgi:hypothetical protein
MELRRIHLIRSGCGQWALGSVDDSFFFSYGGSVGLRGGPRSASGTKRNCPGTQGISGAEGRPAVPSAWRRQPPLTLSGRRQRASASLH